MHFGGEGREEGEGEGGREGGVEGEGRGGGEGERNFRGGNFFVLFFFLT